mmetsp:Transcript_28265/g.92974  ORF Transcript_28265/g.92974 Transcript_28265/m.92974 type:complete len:260 (+) Transcript_28265:1524-2303(+)
MRLERVLDGDAERRGLLLGRRVGGEAVPAALSAREREAPAARAHRQRLFLRALSSVLCDPPKVAAENGADAGPAAAAAAADAVGAVGAVGVVGVVGVARAAGLEADVDSLADGGGHVLGQVRVLQIGQQRRRADGLQVVQQQQDVTIRGEVAVGRLVDASLARPRLDEPRGVAEGGQQVRVAPEQRRVADCQSVVNDDVALHARRRVAAAHHWRARVADGLDVAVRLPAAPPHRARHVEHHTLRRLCLRLSGAHAGTRS